MNRIAPALLACGLAVALSGCAVSADVQKQMSAAPTPSSLKPAPTTSAGSGAHTIVFKATSPAKGSAVVGSDKVEFDMEPLPESWTHTYKTDDANQTWTMSVMGDMVKQSEVACEITKDGKVVASEKGKGMVTCQGS